MSDLQINWGNISIISLADNQNITCLGGWTDSDHTYTNCIRAGAGWNSVNNVAKFSVESSDDSRINGGSNPEVVVYFSDNATYYGDGLDRREDIVRCLNGTRSEPCDRNDIFSAPLRLNGTSNISVVEWSWPGAGENPDFRIWFEFSSHLEFAHYSVEYSVEDSIYFVQLENMKDESTKLIINPLWILAAWSVDPDGTIEATRFPATEMQGFRTIFDQNPKHNLSIELLYEFVALNIFSIAQAMSLLSYESEDLKNSQSYHKNDPNVFYRWNTRRVWAYGLSTRTSKLGVVVVCFGMITVVFRCIFALYMERTEEKSDRATGVELSSAVTVPGSATQLLQGRTTL